jgi:Vacuolar protein sorting-associated protein 62
MTANISIRSATFPRTYLRLDGRGITAFHNSGSGHVNCQSYVGTYEVLQLNKNPDGTFGIRSATFPNVYLRLDAKNFKKSSGNGGGTVNCQFGAAENEKFRLVDQPDGSKAIESVQFPGVYLRMDGTPTPGPFKDPANDNGLGVVNAELSVGPWEKFFIDEITTPLSRADIDTAIQKFGPVIKIHPNERYKPCSIEWFLTYCTLIDAKTGVKTPRPTVSQLPQGFSDAKRYSFQVDDAAKPGDLSTAKAYVHVFWEQGMTVTDLQFWLFSGFNGPATAHVVGLSFDAPVHSGDPDLSPLGDHWADWEYVTLRIDNKSKELIAICLSQHGTGHWTPQSDINKTFQMSDGTHPIVYASLNGHANYPSVGPNYMQYHKFPSPLAIPAGLEFSLHNDTADGGDTFHTSTNHLVVSASFLTGADAYPNVPWVRYSYRWGPEGTVARMRPDEIEQIVKAGFGDFAELIPGDALLNLVGAIVPFFIKSDINGALAPIMQATWQGRY